MDKHILRRLVDWHVALAAALPVFVVLGASLIWNVPTASAANSDCPGGADTCATWVQTATTSCPERDKKSGQTLHVSVWAALEYHYIDLQDHKPHKSTFTCYRIDQYFSPDTNGVVEQMVLDGPVTKCSNPEVIRVAKSGDAIGGSAPSESYQKSTKGDWSGGYLTGAGCSYAQAPLPTFTISNTFDSIPKPSDGGGSGKATWTKENPGQIQATFTLGDYKTDHSETFDELSKASGGVMTLTGGSKCTDPQGDHFDYMTVGDPKANPATTYLTAKEVTVFTYSFDVSEGNQSCDTVSAHIPLTNGAYQDNGGKQEASADQGGDDCPSAGGWGIGWLLCPLFYTGRAAVSQLNVQIQNFLFIDTHTLFETDTFKTPYDNFRNLGLTLLVIAGLVMVISQAAGLDMFSAHTIRKALPRIVMAAIGMSLAWPLMEFIVTFFNDMGSWVGDLILASAHVPGAGTSFTGFGGALAQAVAWIIDIALVGAAGVAAVVFGAMTLMGALSFLATIFIGMLMAAFVLVIRQVVVIICVLLAPLAIAAAVLPGTERIWKFWRETFLGALMMFPIVTAFLAAGAAVGNVAGRASLDHPGNLGYTLIALIATFAPYFMVPIAFRMAGGLMSNVFGMVNDRGKGVFDRLRNFRKSEHEFAHQQRMEGRDWTARGRFARVGNLYRRAHTRGGFGPDQLTAAGRNRYSALDRKRLAVAAENIVSKEDAGFAANDDYANEIAAQRNMTRNRFIEEYATVLNRGNAATVTEAQRQTAARALGTLESSYGARIGSNAMRLSAFKAATRSGTSYRGFLRGDGPTAGQEQASIDAAQLRLRQDAGEMVADGLMTVDEATATIKFNPGAAARKDRSGISYGNLRGQIDNAANGTMTAVATAAAQAVAAAGGDQAAQIAAANAADLASMRNSALDGTKPGELVYGRPEIVQSLSPRMLDRITTAPPDRLQRELARVAGVYDAMNQTNPENAEIMATNVMSQTVTGTFQVRGQNGQLVPLRNPTVRQLIDANRNNEEFVEMRREYTAAGMTNPALAAGQAGLAPNTGNPGQLGPN